MKTYLQGLGKRFTAFLYYIGGVALLFTQSLAWIASPPLKRKQILSQMLKIGVNSLPIVFLTSLFIGMVLAFQSAYAMRDMSGEMYVAALVALSVTREIGPVLTALVVAGRVGASITAELGTMRVTEQIDALETLATNPVKYLVVPRFLALLCMLPILTIYADFIGIVGGYIVGVSKLGISSSMYMKMTWDRLTYKDIFTGLAKAACFAVIICIVACFEGMRTEGGAEGVGRSTTSSVVISFILIIAADCLITALFYFAFQF